MTALWARDAVETLARARVEGEWIRRRPLPEPSSRIPTKSLAATMSWRRSALLLLTTLVYSREPRSLHAVLSAS